jgi:hypothetical protein
MTVKLFTRNPLLPVVVAADNADGGDGQGGDTEAIEGGTFGQEEFGISGAGQ